MPVPVTSKLISLASKEASKVFLKELADSFLSGDIDFASFTLNFLKEMKDEYIRQYLYGIGGREMMTSSDWGSIGGNLSSQYKYANEFLDDYDNGNLSDEQMKARLDLYAESNDEIFEYANEKFYKEDGATLEIWVLGDEAEHCADCLDYADMGWVEIGTLPTPCDGSTACMNNCHCYKEYEYQEEQSVKRIGTESSGNYDHAGRPGVAELRTKKKMMKMMIQPYNKEIHGSKS